MPDDLTTAVPAALAKLREVIAGATPGGWTPSQSRDYFENGADVVRLQSRVPGFGLVVAIATRLGGNSAANATHIATFDPELTAAMARVVETAAALVHRCEADTDFMQMMRANHLAQHARAALAAFVVAAERKE